MPDPDAPEPLVPGARRGPTRRIDCTGCGHAWAIPAALHDVVLRCRLCDAHIALPAAPATRRAERPRLPAAASPERSP
ncbi:MAG: hypothetical protein ACOCXJ_02900, partial [Planctomycetota bacterium]